MTVTTPTKNLAQNYRRQAVLRDVARSGGTDIWPHLSSHGHHFSTVRSCVRSGHLREIRAYVYELTSEGMRSVANSSLRPPA